MKDEPPDVSNAVNVSSLVGILDRYNPSALARLQARYPEAERFLSVGKTLGEQPEASSESSLGALEALAAEALVALKERSADAAVRLEKELSRARFLRLCGNLISGGAAAGVIGSVALGRGFAAVASSVVVIASSGLALAAEYVEGVAGGRENKHVLRDRMRDLIASTVILEGELQLVRLKGSGSGERLDLIRRANSMTADVRRIEFELGIH